MLRNIIKLKIIYTNSLTKFCKNSARLMKVTNGETANINFACDHLLSCEKIQPHGSCYYPNTAINHASAAMNLYYHQYMRKHSWNCDFGNSALSTISDPSYDNCTYAS
ncbi:hypothetical protein K2173_006557 [Erythroxylum novogranatense]|uniref:X8 domain-containing protein n=1 Tax=Erythroxylum novogranatense TaxID=1862640 RepID=A0AAV8T6V7_9ROSI|nr:hypothetical protein K2173_006557 [Erythroxylum novogranatense]